MVVVPEKYTKDKTTEIVNYMLLQVDKNSEYESDAIAYIKYLYKANNNQLGILKIMVNIYINIKQ